MSTPRPIALFVPELFLYGYTAAFFTGSVWLGPAYALILWLFFFLSQAPPAVLTVDTLVAIPSAVLIGSVLGVLVLWVLILPPVLPRTAVVVAAGTKPKRDSALSTTDNDGDLVVQTGWRNHLYVLGLLLIFGPRLALWYVAGTMTLFTVLFLLGFVLTSLVWFLLFLAADRALWLDAKYLVYFELYLFVPWLYSLLISLRPWEGIATLFGLTLLTAGVFVVDVFTISTRARESAPLEGDPRFLRVERTWPRILWRWFVGLWLPLFLVYTSAWIADSVSFNATTNDGNVNTVLISVAIAALVIALVLFCCMAPRAFALYAVGRNGPAMTGAGGVPLMAPASNNTPMFDPFVSRQQGAARQRPSGFHLASPNNNSSNGRAENV